jgi:predicted RNA-binding protein with TRAM domain
MQKPPSIGETLPVKIHRKGRSGDYIAYPEGHTPRTYRTEDGIHLNLGSVGETVRVKILSTQKGFVEAEPVETAGSSSLEAIWKKCSENQSKTHTQERQAPRTANDGDPLSRHREFMSEQNRRHR